MDDTKREELEKACKKIHKVRTRMVAVRMVRVLNMSVDKTVGILVHCPTWARDWLRRYDDGCHEGLRIFPDVGDPEEFHKQQGTASSVRVRCTVSPAILAPAAGNQDVPGLAGRCLFDHAADILSACVRKKSVSLWNLCFIANRYARKYHSGAEIVPGSKSFDST